MASCVHLRTGSSISGARFRRSFAIQGSTSTPDAKPLVIEIKPSSPEAAIFEALVKPAASDRHRNELACAIEEWRSVERARIEELKRENQELATRNAELRKQLSRHEPRLAI